MEYRNISTGLECFFTQYKVERMRKHITAAVSQLIINEIVYTEMRVPPRSFLCQHVKRLLMGEIWKELKNSWGTARDNLCRRESCPSLLPTDCWAIDNMSKPGYTQRVNTSSKMKKKSNIYEMINIFPYTYFILTESIYNNRMLTRFSSTLIIKY